jgi:hypothetical protein
MAICATMGNVCVAADIASTMGNIAAATGIVATACISTAMGSI